MSDPEHTSGEYLGEFDGLALRSTLDDTGRPLLEVHGEDGMAAFEATEEAVDALTEAAAEIQLTFDQYDTEADQTEADRDV
jgi:hypothetical protein